jgi:hypothetical protein
MHSDIFSSVRSIYVLVYRSRRYIKASVTSRCQTFTYLYRTCIDQLRLSFPQRHNKLSSAIPCIHAHPNPCDKSDRKASPSTFKNPLTTLRANLHRRPLRALLALNPARLSLRRVRSALRLLRLLGALGRCALLFAGLDGRFAGRFARFGALRAALFDYV